MTSSLEPTAVVPQAVDNPLAELDPGFPGPVRRAAHVNLLPVEVVAGRRLRATQKALAGGLTAVLVALAGASWATAGQVDAASQELQAEQARTASLTSQQAQFADVTRVQAETTRVRAVQQQVMAGDVRWTELLGAINASAPAGVWLTDLSISLDPAAAADGSPAASTDPLADPAIATIAVTGYASDHDEVAAWLDALTAIPGLSDARYSASQDAKVGTQPVTEFTSTVGVLPEALSHRYDQEG